MKSGRRRRSKTKPSDLSYTGPLAEPMCRPTWLDSPETKDAWAIERSNKMLLLFKHFGVNPLAENAWRDLAMALAERHVPGFGSPRKRGRPREHQEEDMTLVLLVELLRRRDRVGVKAAIRKIADARIFNRTDETLLANHKKAAKEQAALLQFFERVAEGLGQPIFVQCLEDAVGGLLR
jgi:hypothetical protein